MISKIFLKIRNETIKSLIIHILNQSTNDTIKIDEKILINQNSEKEVIELNDNERKLAYILEK
jgi:hypothetical protein